MKRENKSEKDDSLMNLLTTVLLLPVVFIAGGLLLFLFGSFEFFSNLILLQDLPVSTPMLVLGIIGLPIVLYAIIYYFRK